MNQPVSTVPLHTIRPDAAHAFGGIWRLTARRYFSRGHAFMLLGLLALLSILLQASLRDGRIENFYSWIDEFYLDFLLPILGFINGASAMRDEIKSSSADYILTRPINRFALVAFKYVSQLICSQIFYFVVFAYLIGLAQYKQVPGLLSALPLLLLAQAGALCAFTALGFFFAIFTARYLIVGLLYAGTIEAAVGKIPTQLNRISIIHQINVLVNPLLEYGPFETLTWPRAWAAATLIFVFPAVFVSLAGILFSTREIADSPTYEA